MTEPKKLSLIHMERALQLAPRIDDPGVAMEFVATYLATPAQLLKAQKDAVHLETLLEQAAEMPHEESAEAISDFFAQFVKWKKRSLAFSELPEVREMAEAALKMAGSPAASSSST